MDIFGGAPRVLGYSRPVAAQCGTDAVLQCKIGGDPRPEVVWEKKNVQILSEGRYRLSEEGRAYFLHITGVRLEDAGQYICKASNIVGETCAPATLKVEGKSQEREGVQKQTEVNGVQQTRLENGELGGQRNGELRRQQSSELEGQQNQNGEYRQQENLEYGGQQNGEIEQRNGEVDQQSRKVDQQRGAVDQQRGAVDQQSGAVDQQSGAVDQQSGAVDRQSGAVDQQSGAVDQQSGAVEKENGEESELEKKKQRYEGEPLLSDDRPHFLIKPLSLRVDRGEDAAFSCKLSGNPLPQVVWEKDGKKLSDIFESAHFNVSSQDGGWFQLKIFRTRMPDGGVYTCRAHNNQGGALAGAVLLVELVPERQESGASTSNGHSNGQTSPRGMRHRMGRHGLSRQPDEPNLNSANVKKFAVSEGKHAKFRCFVTGKPKPEIIWKKDGVPQEAGRRHLLFEDREGYYTLKVMYCKHQDTGLYVCAASNALGHTLSSVYLTVKAPAVRFRRSLQDVEVRERGMAVLECEVPNEGIPTAWYLEDQRLQAGGKYGIEQNGARRRLTIRDVGADDDGVYLCEMPDGGKSIAELAVKGTIVKKLPRKLDVLEGENAVFCVEVEEENMDVHWFKDGLKLRESHQTILKSFGKTHMLVFVNVCHGDTGVVTFVVGRSKTSSRLRVKAARHSPPICPVGVEMDVDRPNSVLLSWEPAPTSQTTTRSVYVLERQGVGSQEWLRCATSDTATSAEVMGDSVPCEGDYRFRVCCINKYGRSGHVEFPKVVHLVPGPKIRTPLQGCEVTEGEDTLFSIDLSVMVTGTWFLNSTQLQDSQHYSIQQAKTQHSLVIHSTKVEDHEAEVTFIANGVRDSAVLKVQAAVVKFSPMSESDSNKRVETGDPVVLYCEVSHPSASVGWFKDGVELQVTDGLNIQSEGNMRRIIIQMAEFTDSGVYTCETMGDVIKFNVEVEGPPVQFSEVPEEELQKSAMELDPVVLTCEVSREDANATWYKNGVEVQASDNMTIQTEGTMRRLIIRCAETSDAGTYSCQSGDNSLSFTVNIKEPPMMIVEPKEDVVMEGHISEQVVLQCELSRSSGEVHWFKDGLQVLETENVQLTSEGPYRRLTILCGSAEDSGEYVCDTDGDSVFFQVTITELPVRIISPTESELELTSLTSERLELSCEISQPDAQVRWYRDGLEVEESASLILEVQGAHRTLVIPTTTVEDTGEYVCDTEDDSVTWLVTITEPPVKLARSETMSDVMDCFSGEPIVLEIEVSRFNAKVIWMKDGGEVEESSDVTITEDGLIRRLTIRTPAPGDSGKYTCLASDDLIDFQVKVSEPPVKIVNRSEVKTEVKSLPSDDIELECELSRANAVAKWYKDGRRLNEDERFYEEEEGAFRSLVILNAELEDCGDYFLDAGDDNITFHVTVQEPPVTILGNSEDADYQEMVAGDDLILACEVSRANAPVQWYCNDRQLTSDDRTYMESYGTLRKLILSDILPSDSGKYMCDAIDDKMVTMVKIQVPRVVEFLTELHNIMVLEGEDATFKCVVSPEDVQLVWGMDGELVVMGDRFQATQNGLCHTLVIKSCQILDSSKITVEAEGNVSKATLKVQEAQVTFTKKMEAVMAEEYGDATMETEVSLDTGEVQWMRQGVVIQPGPRHTLVQSGRKRSLTICNLNLSDRGTYRCETLHDRTQVKLNVEPRKIAIRKGLVETDTFERETASFEVELSHTGVEGFWQKDGIRVKPSNHWRVSCNGLVHGLTLSNLTLDDTGTIVFSAEGVRTSARLTVKETPVTLMKKLVDMRLEQGSPATLECELSRQNVEVRWLKNGTELKPGKTQYRIYSMGRKRFCQLLQCSLSDAGTYTCDVGDVNTSCNLEVYEPEVEVLHGLEDLYVQEDQNAVFMCEVSMEDVTGEWYKDGHKIRPTSTIKIRTEGTKHFLLMCNVKAEDSGEIRFVTKQTESTAYLEVEEAPVSIVKPLRDRTALEKHRVILDCTVSTPRCELTWYRGKAELESSDRLEIHSDGCYHKLTIHEATVEDEGTYSIEVGEHSSTAQLLVEAQSLVIETELQDVVVTAPDQACFQCEVSVAISRPPVWTLNGETIQSSPDVRLENHGTVHKLNLKQTRPDMSGTVTFAMGKAKSSAKLNVMWK
uniref:obscurin-like protein 1 n=1 Tax=Oncorhynchus gorbuscha TaxID=8017 RepID=UPI001EAF3DC7|nr:obscurin-like protein 1 [Oncorhynchus gorbuscha]